MELASQILSDITVHMKYARYLPENNRRELFSELVDRNKQMHIKKYPHMKEEIEAAYQYVYEKKVLPSMRSMQFGGKPIGSLIVLTCRLMMFVRLERLCSCSLGALAWDTLCKGTTLRSSPKSESPVAREHTAISWATLSRVGQMRSRLSCCLISVELQSYVSISRTLDPRVPD